MSHTSLHELEGELELLVGMGVARDAFDECKQLHLHCFQYIVRQPRWRVPASMEVAIQGEFTALSRVLDSFPRSPQPLSFKAD